MESAIVQAESDSGSGDSSKIPSLFDSETVINLTPEQISAAEENVRHNFTSRLDINTIERPGICNIFPREEFKFEPSQEYIDHEEHQAFLYKVAHEVYELKRELISEVDLPLDYEDKYIKFQYLEESQLHKPSSINEEDFIKKGHHLK